MTQDEIEHMWKVASNNPNHDTNWHDPVVIAFAKLVAAKEREACAKAIQQSRAYQLVWYPEGYSINPNKIDIFYEFQWKRSVDAIRARGQA